MIRIGILGCGRIARMIHIKLFAQLAGVEVVALADNDPASLHAACAIRPRAKRFTSWQALIDAGVTDAVVVTLPPALHGDATIAAFSAGNHVYLEKPLALSIDHGERVLASQAAAGKIGQIGLNFRHNPIYAALRQRVSAGEAGNVVAVRTLFCSARRALPGWKRVRETGGGVMRDLGAHHLDLIQFLLNDRIETLSAIERSVVQEADFASVSGEMVSGTIFEMTFSLVTGQSVNRVELFGGAGHFTADASDARPRVLERPPARFARLAKIGTALARIAPAELRKPPGHEPSFGRAFAAFADSISRGTPASPNLADGLTALKLVTAAERAAAHHTRVRIGEG